MCFSCLLLQVATILCVQKKQQFELIIFVELSTIQVFRDFIIGFLPHRGDCFVPSCPEELHAVVPLFDFQEIRETQKEPGAFLCCFLLYENFLSK